MAEDIRFDRSSLTSAGEGFLDAAADFERHTGSLLASVRGAAETAWGGTSVGVAMDRLGGLLDDACRVLHSNLHQTGDGIRTMADDFRATEAAASAAVPDPGVPGTRHSD
ncbi:hypothetical protein [Nonomuraea sp. B1E8]|uniref:hypothetical protein n=1 Tax=unclassified Nonomuraea TaxID=2593643 RepID=UPI00325E54EE